MRKSIVDLIEAVRSIKLSPYYRGEERRVQVGVPPSELLERLLTVHDALEAVDADGGVGLKDEAEKLRAALDSTFHWIRLQGLSTDEPLDLVAQALGAKAGKKQAAYDILPAFAPTHVRKKGSWKPKLRLPLEQLRVMRSIDSHRKTAFDIEQVTMRMGSVAPVEAEPAAPLAPVRN